MWYAEKEKRYWSSLLKEGSLQYVESDQGIPEFFDPVMFKRGHSFVRNNLFAVFVGNLTGIITMLTLRSILDSPRVFRLTASMDSMLKALQTMTLTFEFYGDLPQDHFRLQSALGNFKRNLSYQMDDGFFTQRDLALWPFAFSGYVTSRPHLLGIDPMTNKENLAAFNHFWRVVGHCLGIDERFNLCAEDVHETIDRVLEMTPRLIGPAFTTHSNTYVKTVLDFVEIFWYFTPFISIDSFLFLSNRLAGIPGYYLSEEERQKDLFSIDGHQGYLHTFNRQRLECEFYSPKCFTFVRKLSWKDRAIIVAVVHLFEMYCRSAVYKWVLNSFIGFGCFCKRKLSFLVVCLGFDSHGHYWEMRRNVLINLKEGGRRMYGYEKRVVNKDQLNCN